MTVSSYASLPITSTGEPHWRVCLPADLEARVLDRLQLTNPAKAIDAFAHDYPEFAMVIRERAAQLQRIDGVMDLPAAACVRLDGQKPLPPPFVPPRAGRRTATSPIPALRTKHCHWYTREGAAFSPCNTPHFLIRSQSRELVSPGCGTD